MGGSAAVEFFESRTADSSARVKFIALWVLLFVAKLALAAVLPLFGDEAFYAWEALHPAWAYSDLPGGTAAAVGLGGALADVLSLPRELGVRLLFVVAGAAIPWVVVRTAARLGTADQAWRAGLWSLPIPLLVPMGVLALPDALMTLAAVLALDACVGLLADRPSRSGLYAQFAVALALGALTHYRFGPILLVGALAFLAAGGWRRRGDPGLWLALLVGVAAWWPIAQFNLDAQGAGLHFQLVERHPWRFNAKGLLQPILQAVITTPLLYGLLGWALWVNRRASRADIRFVALAGGGLWLFYALLAPFVDKARFSLHWPIPAYLLAATLLPMALDAAKGGKAGRWARWAGGLASAGLVAMFAAFTVPASPWLSARTAGTALYPDNFLGWDEISRAVQPRLADADALVADHFMLAAQLSFSLGGRREVFVLDHWNNHKHGRAPQLALWGYDEAALSRIAPGTRAWIAFEVAETPERERQAWVARTCRWFTAIDYVATIEGPGGGKRFWLYRGIRANAGESDPECTVRLPSR